MPHLNIAIIFFFSSRRRHTRLTCDWSSDVCSSDLVDLVIATASLAVVSLMVDLPRKFRRVADTLGIATLLLLGIVVIVIYVLEVKLAQKPDFGTGPRRLPGRLMGALLGLHAMGTSPSFYSAVLASLLMPFCQVLGLWAMMKAYGLHLPFNAAIVVLLVI